ncbi:peptidase inhibitor family I36 protein [Streptomyces sp. NPDC057638]|uniref:peptidase inhibitor family I36 protein n=1 Tax=Streptomyces sp. NPDC057638 TaxID=3346190 RepID=UPI0036B18B9D
MRTAVTAAALSMAAALLPVPLATTASAAPSVPTAPTARPGGCPPGALCLWSGEDFRGTRTRHELYETEETDSCLPLPPGTSARSLVNRTGRQITTYQSPECAETGEFETYPTGVWVPASPHLVRAFMIRER